MELLITGAWQDAKNHIIELEERGHRVHFLQYEKEGLPCSPNQIEGVICNGLFLYHEISEFTRLRYIQLTSAGYDRAPMEYIKGHSIEIYNAQGVYSVPMAEYVIAGVLYIYKKQDGFRENQKLHKWEKQRDLLELYGKTVCILGCGSVGIECAKRFKAFGCNVIGVNRTVSQKEHFDFIVAMNHLNEMLNKADVIVLALPLANDTYHLLNVERFAFIKKGAIIVNVARGAVVDTKALELCIDHIGGAVLDVFEEEPLPTNSLLWDRNNIIITPHNSYVGEESGKRLSECVLRNLERASNFE